MEYFENVSVATQFALAGVFFLVFPIAGIVVEYRFRKRAVCVSARLVKSFEFHRYTSYYMRYEHDGQTLNLYYRAPHLTPALEQDVDYLMLVEPSALPDIEVPQTNARIALDQGEPSSASMANAPLVGGWTWAVLVAGAVMLVFAGVSGLSPQ